MDGQRPFSRLTTLEISDMSNLEEWSTPDSVESFPCLTQLTISGCRKLGSFPSLPSLRRLSINDVKWSVVASLKNLTSLESLSLWLNESVDAIPGDLLQNNKALQYLAISGRSIKSLSISMLDNLSGLKTLKFSRCNSLESLPEGLSCSKSLERLILAHCHSLIKFPESLRSLESLRMLDIWGCLLLEERCERPNGEDWPKISHIPTIRINFETIQEVGVNALPGDLLQNNKALQSLTIIGRSIKSLSNSMLDNLSTDKTGNLHAKS